MHKHSYLQLLWCAFTVFIDVVFICDYNNVPTFRYYCTIIPELCFLLFVLQSTVGYKNKIKCGRMSASMKWRHLDHLQLLQRAVALIKGMAEIEISP